MLFGVMTLLERQLPDLLTEINQLWLIPQFMARIIKMQVNSVKAQPVPTRKVNKIVEML